jgi:hypothetical protein
VAEVMDDVAVAKANASRAIAVFFIVPPFDQ